MCKNISTGRIHQLIKAMSIAYQYLYDMEGISDSFYSRVTSPLCARGDELLSALPNDVIRDIVDARGDCITSDREIAAFAMAADSIGITE